MNNFGNFDQQDQIPPLVPLKRKKVDAAPISTPSQKNNLTNDVLANILKDSVKNTPKNDQVVKDEKNIIQPKKQPNPQKIQQIQKKTKQKISTVQKKDNQANKIQNQRIKQAQKTKFFIAKQLNSMSLKNLSEQLYPVSNQAIQQLLSKIEQQILQLNKQAQKKQSTLALNQNNLHLKKELQTIRREIDHCCLIKQLYYQKMNYRNKILTIQQDIINLRNENKQLKIKVAKGLETIENYQRGLPTNNQKQLKEKLIACKEELRQEKETRQNLQKNIQTIINNFKRLYQEADVARQIVIKKLKEVQERQRKLRKMKEIQDNDNSQDSPVRRVASLQVGEDKKNTNNTEFNNDYNLNSSRRLGDQDMRRFQGRHKTQNSQRDKEQMEKLAIPEAQTSANMTLEEKIRKMRSNQLAFTKNL